MQEIKKRFGLLGRNISYSFSKGYFTDKFAKENLENHSYENFDIQEIDALHEILAHNKDILGLNVTIPYKEVVLPFLSELSEIAKKIGAVNTIKFAKNGALIGYNTDYYGFKKSLEPLLQAHHKKALILGTGGAAKGVAYALEELGIVYEFVSREPKNTSLRYADINQTIFNDYQIIINASPVGTSPNIDKCPELPYALFTEQHIAYDLIYNPAETMFLNKAKSFGAATKNGQDMLIFQAEKAWEIWTE